MQYIYITLTLVIVNTIIKYLPFVVFKNKTPNIVIYLGKVLPKAIMAMLVIYCLKTSIINIGSEYITLIGALIVVIIHLVFKNTLLSVGLGTIIYMVLLHI